MTALDHQLFVEQSRRVAVWRDVPKGPPRGSFVICGGFSRRMSELSSLVAYALANGAIVYRFDSLDHVGLSDGVIRNFTLSAMQRSLEATLAWVAEMEGDRPCSLIATSLSALPAYRVTAENPRISALACLVGVVDGRKTLERVFGVDYIAWEYDSLPETVVFEGHEVDPRRLVLDHLGHRWLDAAHTEATIAQIKVPVVNLVASEDQWVTADEVRAAFSAEGAGPREIVEMPYGGHELARNPVAIRLALRHLIAGLLYGGDLDAVVEPTFDEIGDFRVADRQRAQDQKSSAHEASLRGDASATVVES